MTQRTRETIGLIVAYVVAFGLWALALEIAKVCR